MYKFLNNIFSFIFLKLFMCVYSSMIFPPLTCFWELSVLNFIATVHLFSLTYSTALYDYTTIYSFPYLWTFELFPIFYPQLQTVLLWKLVHACCCMCVQMYHGYAGVESLIKVYTSLFADATVCARVVLPSCTPPAVYESFWYSTSSLTFRIVSSYVLN